MSLTESKMAELGMDMPEFSLTNVVDGAEFSSEELNGKKATLVMFICRHCPYVKHVQGELSRLGNEYQKKGVGVVAISANDPNYDSADAPESLAEQAQELGFEFSYLFDETQEVAKEFGAACTPDLFVFDERKKLVYRGQLDDSRPGNEKPVTGKDLQEALDAVLSGGEVSKEQKPSSGCNIKWKV